MISFVMFFFHGIRQDLVVTCLFLTPLITAFSHQLPTKTFFDLIIQFFGKKFLRNKPLSIRNFA